MCWILIDEPADRRNALRDMHVLWSSSAVPCFIYYFITSFFCAVGLYKYRNSPTHINELSICLKT